MPDRVVIKHLRVCAEVLSAAREQLDYATGRAQQAALDAAAAGIPQTVIASELGIDRARTLRRWLGKQ
jgi:hypothetical protein